jgi:ribosomal protein L25 (general stress protein Ctc)
MSISIFDSYDILKFGNELQISGVVFSNGFHNLVICFPDSVDPDAEFYPIHIDLEDWKKIIRQTDLLETEIIEQAVDGKLVKAIIRKTTRQIENKISWKVFKRDGYKCRYCGNDDTPLTVDHLVLWEEMGPSIEENLVSACRKCNKKRGSMQYKDWIFSDYYNKVKEGIDVAVEAQNLRLIEELDNIPLRKNVRNR